MTVLSSNAWSAASLQLQQQSLLNNQPQSDVPGRQQQLRRFTELGWPNRQDEKWRYARLHALKQQQFTLPSCDTLSAAAHAVDIDAYRLVFCNGVLHEASSQLPQGVSIEDQCWSACSEALSNLAEAESLLSLNQGLLTESVVLTVDSNVQLKKPLELVFRHSTETQVMHHRQVLVKLAAAAKVDLILHAQADEVKGGMISEALAFDLQDDAQLNFLHYVNSEQLINYIGYHCFDLGKNVQCEGFYADGCQGFYHQETHVNLKADKAKINLFGLRYGCSEQYKNHQVFMRHYASGTESTQSFKSLADDKARIVFNGSIFVAKESASTTAHLTNNNLLLSEQAEADSKPELVIHNDDVQCSHGATIGQLDEHALFYLVSRGLHRDQAIELLTTAFQKELLEKFGCAPLKSLLYKKLQLSEVDHD